jgi:hypothetical protein
MDSSGLPPSSPWLLPWKWAESVPFWDFNSVHSAFVDLNLVCAYIISSSSILASLLLYLELTMSRYSKQELWVLRLQFPFSFICRLIYFCSEKLKKSQLLELVHRQPEVTFPTKIGSGPLASLTVRQLRAGLFGPHGYTKAITSLEESQATLHEIIDGDRNSSSPPSSSVFEVRSMFQAYTPGWLNAHYPGGFKNCRTRSTEPVGVIGGFLVHSDRSP